MIIIVTIREPIYENERSFLPIKRFGLDHQRAFKTDETRVCMIHLSFFFVNFYRLLFCLSFFISFVERQPLLGELKSSKSNAYQKCL